MTGRFTTNITAETIRSGIELAKALDAHEDPEKLKEQSQRFEKLVGISAGIEETIEYFNLGVEASFKAGGVENLAGLCTQNGIERMRQKYAAWRQKQITALNLIECAFLACNLADDNPNRARAYTFEKWVFVYENGQEVHTQGSVDGYDLVFEEGRWKVNYVETFAREMPLQ